MKSKSSFLCAGVACVILVFAGTVLARQGTPPLSRSQKVQELARVRQFVTAPTDPRAEVAADARVGVVTPLRYAVPTLVRITPADEGTWEDVPGGRLWRLRIASDGATDLNFGFTTCSLPEGATLHVFSEGEDYVQGPYTARDNKGHGQLWTPVVPGSRAVIELFVPAGVREQPRLVLSQINRGYRDLFHREKDLSTPKAGSCNIDVVCPQADPWRSEIRSVARYSINGSELCSGTLINNVSNDFKNYFLTANHCGVTAGSAASVVVYWNFQSPACGQHGGGSLSHNQSGAIFRAAKADVDFTLIELDDIPDATFQVYYAGWDHSGTAPPGAVGIHHPNGDEKSISFSSNTLTTVDSCIGNGSSTHWNVVWSLGVTEPGSSGSGIWNPTNHRLIGTLSGGDSLCSAPQGPDCYGKFSVAWASGTSASSRLRDWLDPANTGGTTLAGRDPNPFPLLVAAGSALVSEGCLPANAVIDSGETVTVSLAVQNVGASSSVNLIGTLLATNGVTSPGAPQTFGVVAAGGAAVARNFSFTAGGACGSLITPRLQLQDGTNNLGLVSFTFRVGTPLLRFTQNFDSVSTPNLPSGWSNSATGSTGWSTVSTMSDTPSHSVFASDASVTSDAALTSPAIAISNASAQVVFRHSYDTEYGSAPFDGGVLEISYNGGPWNDIVTAGGSFVSGGYNGTISSAYNSPIAGRDAWSGNSGGFITTTANLPVTAAAQSIRLRWRMASDNSIGSTGWYVDTVSIIDGYACCSSAVTTPVIVETRPVSTKIVFSFDTIVGHTYVTEYKQTFATNAVWTPFQTNMGDGLKKSVTNSFGAATSRFFRVRTQ